MGTSMYDAAVVLGAGINPRGEISSLAKERINKAVAIAQDTVPIIMTGRWSYLIDYTPPTTEAAAMKSYSLVHHPILKTGDHIFVEDKSMDTIGNAYFTKTQLLAPHMWQHIAILVSDFNAERSTYIFRKILGENYDITTIATPSGLSSEELHMKTAVENKLLMFTKQLLGPISDGDHEAVNKIMELFPGYSSKPVYTREALLQLVDPGTLTIDTYGINVD